ncbi:hypothetical protein EK904_004916, partial [Melospiza melodia maxima]
TGQRCSPILLTAGMLEEDNDEICWNNLENFRVKLISVIEPSRITPYLRQCKVLSPDDEEQVLNDPSLVMRKRKAGVLLDILQRTGHKGFEAFMESLELYYPQLYKKITGKEPSRVFSMIIGNIDQLKHSLMKAEDDCKLERKHTMKLKHAIEQRPSHEVVWEIQQEKELLLAKNQELENTLQVAREQNLEKSLSKETLENECSQTVEERRELVNTIYSLRKELRRAKVLQDKEWGQSGSGSPHRQVLLTLSQQFAEEKEVLELQCTSLRKDSQMYKKRIEAVLQQMEEVASERDQALLTREQFHMQYCKNLVERDAYRKQIRELGERCDEMQLQLFQKESQLLATEAKLKRLQLELPTLTSDLDDSSSRDFQELVLHSHLDEDTQTDKKDCLEVQNQELSPQESHLPPKSPSECGLANEELAEKERRRMKDCFERYRRKRAMRRAPKDRHHEADWENTSGSDNTDTEGS